MFANHCCVHIASTLQCNLDDENAAELVKAIRYLNEESETFKNVLQRQGEYALFDGWFYFVDKLKQYPEWGGKDWIPSEEDLLQARIRTAGGKTFCFLVGKQEFQLTDVGGQRNERRKFFFLFNEMDCLLFVASLSEYNEALFEDSQQNRLRETIRVWKETVHHPDFRDKYIILFLNKFDLFKKKYYHEKIPIVTSFRYKIKPPLCSDEVDQNCGKAIQWYKDLYLNQVPQAKANDIKVFVTSAMDSKSLSKAMRQSAEFLQAKIHPKAHESS